MILLHYALFLVPMLAVFAWVSYRHGVRQALLDLIAFNLFFNFDLAALLPGNINLMVLHLLMLALLGCELLAVLVSGKIRVSRRLMLVFAIGLALLIWAGVTTFMHRTSSLGLGSTLNLFVLAYLFGAMFFVGGVRLARTNRGARFVYIALVAAALAGGISVVQTASGGRLLSTSEGDYYLGIFQPLGAKSLDRRDMKETELNFTESVRMIRLGALNFYRASGPYDGAYNLICVAAITAFVLMLSRRRATPPGMPLVFCAAAAGLICTFSRTTLVTLVLIVGVVLLIRFRTLISPRVLLGLLPILALVIVLAFTTGPVATVIQAVGDSFFGERWQRDAVTLTGRTSLWAFVLGEIRAHPLVGNDQPITAFRVGWGSSDNAAVELSAHNILLDFAYRNGIPAALLLAALLGFLIVRSLRLWLTPALAAEHRMAMLAFCLGAGATVLLNMMSTPLRVPQVFAAFWLACGFLAVYRPVLAGAGVEQVAPAAALPPLTVGQFSD